jgi:hypothetical protein
LVEIINQRNIVNIISPRLGDNPKEKSGESLQRVAESESMSQTMRHCGANARRGEESFAETPHLLTHTAVRVPRLKNQIFSRSRENVRKNLVGNGGANIVAASGQTDI